MNEQEKWNVADAMLWAFRGIIIILGIGFLCGQIFLPAEGESKNVNVEVFNAEWEMVLEDGTRQSIEVPGEYEVPKGEEFVAETLLSEEIASDTWLCFHGRQQDMDIYIDDELRERYTTKDSRLFGKSSASALVFVELHREDAGKTLRLVTRSDSLFSGVMQEIHIGDRFSIWMQVCAEQGQKVLIAIILAVLSLITIVASMILRIGYRKQIVLEYLGWAILFCAMWIVCDSNLRQILYNNFSLVSCMGFMAIMLIPLPFLLYVNALQEGRYEKWYIGLTLLGCGNLVICTSLQVLNVVDFVDSMVMMHAVLALSILLIGITIFIDWRKKRVQKYILVAIGMIVMLVAACLEILFIYIHLNRSSGLALSSSLLVLLVMAVWTTARDIMSMEREKQRAIVSGETKIMFLANMSHEIRTPINTIIGMNEVIMRENQDENLQEYLYNIQNASKMLLTLVNDVLDFSKIDTGHIELENYPYHPSSMLNDLIHVLESKASKKNLEVHLNIDKNIPTVLNGDEVRVKQVISNLLTNAVKYTDRGSITFSVIGDYTEEGAFGLKIKVSDTGIGIKEEDLERVFVRFARLDQKKNRYIEGTGLGLSITKLLVEKMEGHIDVASEYGKGSVFTVWIPQSIEDLGPMGDLGVAYKEELEAEQTHQETIYIPGAEILVVDDNKMNLAVVKALLKNTGILLDTASSGYEAIEKCKEKKYHLIFMDHMMPGLDGIETLHLIKRNEQCVNVNTNVIALTANAVSGSKEKYIAEGFDDYISKPIEVEHLEDMLEQYLSGVLEVQRREIVPEDKSDSSEQMNEGEGTLQETENTQKDTVDITKNKQEKENEKMSMSEEQVKELTYVDQEMGLQYCAECREVYIEMLEIYLEQGENYMVQLPKYVQEEDWKNYTISVHGLKGTSLTIGAQAFSEKAKEQEFAAKGEEYDFIRGSIDEFLELYKKMLEVVKGIIDAE